MKKISLIYLMLFILSHYAFAQQQCDKIEIIYDHDPNWGIVCRISSVPTKYVLLEIENNPKTEGYGKFVITGADTLNYFKQQIAISRKNQLIKEYSDAIIVALVHHDDIVDTLASDALTERMQYNSFEIWNNELFEKLIDFVCERSKLWELSRKIHYYDGSYHIFPQKANVLTEDEDRLFKSLLFGQ